MIPKIPEVSDEELLAALGGNSTDCNETFSHEIQAKRDKAGSCSRKDLNGIFNTVSNNLIQNAVFELSPIGDAIVQVAASKINPKSSKFEPIRITGREILIACHYNPNSGSMMKKVKDALDAFHKKPIKLAIEDEETGFRIERSFHWFDHADVLAGEGKLVVAEVEFHKFLKKELLGLSTNFTKTYLKYALPINEIFARRLYRICKSMHYDTTKTYTFHKTVSQLKMDMGITVDIDEDTKLPDPKYSDWSRFKQRRLDPAIKQINEKTDINVFYDRVIADNGQTVGVDITVGAKDPVSLLKLEMKIKETEKKLLGG